MMKKLRLSEGLLTPLILLGTCLAAYGLQVLWLGYTLDDWIILHSYTSGGLHGLMEYSFMGSRPLVFWIWELGFVLLGTAPLGWHLWTLLWRFLTVLIFWVLLRQFWPQQARRTALAALLFAVYPIFFQQPSALTFSFHWVCYFLSLLSLVWMVRAVQGKGSWLALSAAAILAGAASLFSQEFFLGFEALRPLLIWAALGGAFKLDWPRLRRTLFQWAPYLLLLAGYLLWRLVFMPVPGADRNTPQVLYGLLKTPLDTLPELLVMVLRDFVNGLAGVWYRTYQPGLIVSGPLSALMAWGLAGAVFAGLYLLFSRVRALNGEGQPEDGFIRGAVVVGLLAMLVGFAPGWTTGRSMSDTGGLYNDRFGLAAMAGVSLLLVGLVEGLLKSRRARTALLCLLVALAVGAHFRSTTEYRWSWEQQTRLYWQLKWRAPALQPPTAIYGDGALVKFIGSWATISAINEVYDVPPGPTYEPYWYFDLTKQDMLSIVEKGLPVTDIKNNLRYLGNASQSLVIQADAIENQCLWVVSLQDIHNPYLTPQARIALPISDPGRIQFEPDTPLDANIFGPEIAHDWCYYYEKASLARQQADWERVMQLWNEAAARGLNPNNEPELVPFIHAAARTGDWDLAQQLTRQAYFPDYVMHDYLCTTWREIDDATRGQPGQAEAVQAVIQNFDCQGIIQP